MATVQEVLLLRRLSNTYFGSVCYKEFSETEKMISKYAWADIRSQNSKRNINSLDHD